MNENNDEDNSYADWLSGALSDEDFAQAEGLDSLKILKGIVAESDQWKLPEVKTSYEAFRLRIGIKSEKLKPPTPPTRVVPLFRIMSIAAAVILTIGFMAYYYIEVFNVQKHETLAGEIKEFTLPDDTRVTLNGSSVLTYNNNDSWLNDKEVEIEGQAFFEVVKKGPFKVIMEDNSVHVLGTKFDVFNKGGIQVVKCFEGKVKVDIQGKAFELIPGKELIFNGEVEEGTFEEKEPSWVGDYTKFNNSQLIEVLEALALRYNYEFTYEADVLEVKQKFTGQFINHDKALALKMVFDPLGIRYEVNGKTVTLKK